MKKKDYLTLILSIGMLLFFVVFVTNIFNKLDGVIGMYDELFESNETDTEKSESEFVEDQTELADDNNTEKCFVSVKITKYVYDENSVPNHFELLKEPDISKFLVSKNSTFSYEFPIITENYNGSDRILYPMYNTKISEKINFDCTIDVFYYQSDYQIEIVKEDLVNGECYYVCIDDLISRKCVEIRSKLTDDLEKIYFVDIYGNRYAGDCKLLAGDVIVLFPQNNKILGYFKSGSDFNYYMTCVDLIN